MFISRVENASLCPYKSNITVPMAIAPGSMDVMLSLLLLDGHIVNVHVHVYVHVKDSGFDYLAFNLKTKLITLPCQKCVVVVVVVVVDIVDHAIVSKDLNSNRPCGIRGVVKVASWIYSIQ